ncbi:MAG: sigma-70 family RNA polymerase sigma factor [Gemmatimonadaceae bacterium]|nr:sigma-70 family RNA polymerase sigma factor [Gloeobacterales cyanobacterium ES-bin-141]
MPPKPLDKPSANRQPGSDTELVRALVAGRLDALGLLYDRYGALVYGLALSVLTSPQEAEDLSQEIFLAFCRNCKYNPERGSLGSYLITLTRSRAIDRLRSRDRASKLLRRWGQVAVNEPLPLTPIEHATLSENAQQVREALARLPSNQRQVIELSYFKGLSQAEIASQLNTPLGTVKSWVRRGLLDLRQSLQDFVG